MRCPKRRRTCCARALRSIACARSSKRAARPKRKRRWIAASQYLLDKSNENWKLYLETVASTLPKDTLETLTAQHDALTKTGVEPKFAAIRANDMAAYHAIADTKISPMFVSFDQVVTAAVQFQQKHADKSRARTASEITTLNVTIGALLVMSLLILIGTRFMLRGLIIKPIEEAVDHFERIAQSDLTHSAHTESTNEIGRLFAGIERMRGNLTSMVGAVHRGAESIDVGAHEIASGNTDLSQRTEEQAASLQETVSSMEQLTSTVK